MNYVDVCTGISAPTVAWKPLGWKALAYAEIDKFPKAVLKHHYPEVKNVGDFTKIEGTEFGPVDVLVGGTPCQDFSVAGLRAGLDGERGNLTLEFLRLVDRMRPRWVAWENVPGVISSTSHRAPDPCPPPDPLDMELDGQEVDTEDEYDSEELHALNSFLAGLSELGYGWAYGVLDAQHFGVPQRRRRVFVVGHLGDWRRAAAVLFDAVSLSGHPPPRREAGKAVAPTISARTKGGGGLGTDFDCDGGLVAFGGNNTAGVATARNAHAGPSGRLDFETETFVVSTLDASYARLQGCSGQDANHGHSMLVPTLAIQGAAGRENPDSGPDGVGVREDGISYTLEARSEVQAVMTLAIRGRDGEPSLEVREDGTSNAILTPNGGRGGIGVGAVAIQNATRGKDQNGLGISDDGSMYTLDQGSQHGVAIALSGRARGDDGRGYERPEHISINLAGTLDGVKTDRVLGISAMQVRRLTPVECERLQGFPEVFERMVIELCEDESSESARSADLRLAAQRLELSERVDVLVRIDLERQFLQLLSRGRCLWSASAAESQRWFHPSMRPEDFVHHVAHTLTRLAPTTQSGAAVSRPNTQDSSHLLSGSGFVRVSGREIDAPADAAERFISTSSDIMRFTTSLAGHDSQAYAATLKTWCCSVVGVMSSCIPAPIPSGCLFGVEVHRGYTKINAKTADGPRYKALGNSMAVPVLRWIGQRIQAVDEMVKEGKA